MADVVTVFSRAGEPLDELDVSIVRHLLLDHSVNFDRGSFTIPVADPKATEKNLRRNNFILVTSNQPGIKPWPAIIYPDENTGLLVNRNSEYIVPLRGAEWLLGQRVTATIEKITPAMSPGNIFIKVLEIAQRAGAFAPISQAVGDINLVGEPTEPEWNLAECYGIANQLSTDNDMYWGFTASRDYDVSTGLGTGNLILKPYFKTKVGQRHSVTLIARSSGGTAAGPDAANLVGSQVQEKSIKPFANRIIAYGKMDDWKEDLTKAVDNEDSQGDCGIVVAVADFTTIDNEQALLEKAQKELKLHLHRLYVDGTLINVSAFPSIGDTCLVQPDYSGAQFLAEKYGTTLRMRVKETNYNPQNNSMALNLEGLFADE